MVNGTTEINGVPYRPGTSQDTIVDIDEKDARVLVNSGAAIIIDDPPKPPLTIFPESSGKLKAKIQELQVKLSEAERESEALLNDDDLADVAGITRKIDAANGRVFSLKALLRRQEDKLERAVAHEEMEAEKIAVKNLEKECGGYQAEAKKNFDKILDATDAIEINATAFFELRDRILKTYSAAGGNSRCPFLNALQLPPSWKEDVGRIRSHVNADMAGLSEAAARTPKELQNLFNSKRMKTASQLDAEVRERELRERREHHERECAD
jgi:hypothetical protein